MIFWGQQCFKKNDHEVFLPDDSSSSHEGDGTSEHSSIKRMTQISSYKMAVMRKVAIADGATMTMRNGKIQNTPLWERARSFLQ